MRFLTWLTLTAMLFVIFYLLCCSLFVFFFLLIVMTVLGFEGGGVGGWGKESSDVFLYDCHVYISALGFSPFKINKKI